MKNVFLKSALALVMSILFLGCSGGSDDPGTCLTIACQNGGSFVDCECNCPVGFTGENCSTQLTPSKIKITKIKVQLFPGTRPNGIGWDGATGDPDIYVSLNNGTSPFSALYTADVYYENAVNMPNVSYDFTPASPIQITNILAPYIISLRDLDDNVYEEMDSNSFFIYTAAQKFPAVVRVDNGANFVVDFNLTYEF